MNDQLDNVDQTPVGAVVPASLARNLGCALDGYNKSTAQRDDQITICRSLLRQAKDLAGDQFEEWLGRNFRGSMGLARFYMHHGTELEGSIVNQTLRIPPPGKSLRFSSNDLDGGSALCIEPAYREGYYYLTRLLWTYDQDFCSSHAEGPREPIWRDEIWETCERLDWLYLVEGGERTESPSTPLAFNRWQFEGHVQQRQPDADQQPQAEQGSARDCSTDDLSDGGGN